jgi:hypothetical protein
LKFRWLRGAFTQRRPELFRAPLGGQPRDNYEAGEFAARVNSWLVGLWNVAMSIVGFLRDRQADILVGNEALLS